jgi:hypothetical protein
MSGSTLVIIELTLTFGIAIGWGLWELYQLKKGR